MYTAGGFAERAFGKQTALSIEYLEQTKRIWFNVLGASQIGQRLGRSIVRELID